MAKGAKTHMVPMDLHTHSNMSDGTCTPSLLVEKAKAAGLGILALTDHDCIQGLPQALEAGERLGIRVIPGLELDTEFPTELHMLGLGVDPQHPALQDFAARNALRRQERNEKILAQLAAAGADVRPFFPPSRARLPGCTLPWPWWPAALPPASPRRSGIISSGAGPATWKPSGFFPRTPSP